MAKRTRLDINRLAQAAIEAAFEDEQPRRRRFSGMHAVAAGAALATAARFAAKKAPAFLPSPPKVSDLAGSVRDRLADSGWIGDEEPGEPEDILGDEWEEPDGDEDEEEEDEAPEEEDEEDDTPEDEEDDTPEDEGDDWEDDDGGDDDTDNDDEPQASGDEDWDDEEDESEEEDEPEEEPAPAIELGTNGDGREAASSGVPDLMSALATHRRPPVMRRRRQNEVDPAGQPPKRPRKSKA